MPLLEESQVIRDTDDVERLLVRGAFAEANRGRHCWLGKAKASGFRGVPEPVWNFHIGGYQVCEKWLKDRTGRALTADDIAHYQKIVVALSETIRLMSEIDAVIAQHGGWPLK